MCPFASAAMGCGEHRDIGAFRRSGTKPLPLTKIRKIDYLHANPLSKNSRNLSAYCSGFIFLSAVGDRFRFLGPGRDTQRFRGYLYRFS